MDRVMMLVSVLERGVRHESPYPAPALGASDGLGS